MTTASDASWCEGTAVLPADVDLHARPAAELVRALTPFEATVRIGAGSREADAKSLLAILGLGARRGTQLRLRATGPDATEALDVLTDCVTGFSPDPGPG